MLEFRKNFFFLFSLQFSKEADYKDPVIKSLVSQRTLIVQDVLVIGVTSIQERQE